MAPTILCLASYEKGHDFMRECAESGARVILVTVEKLRDAPWPRDLLAELFLLPSFDNLEHVINAISYLARTEHIARIVALDEFDLEIAAALREHLRVPGSGITATRAVRDKLAMRELADAAGIAVPAFTRITNHGDVAAYLAATQGPWVLKPRMQASAIGIRKIHEPQELWPALHALGDLESHHLLERFVSGDVYHVDGIVAGGRVQFAEVHRYAEPPFDVMHEGGVFCTRTVERGCADERALRRELDRLVRAVDVHDSAVHAEFICERDTGEFHFLEIAARVGGAHISDMVYAATGVNLWREWARLELAVANGTHYTPRPPQRKHAGVLISLARQEWPDMSAYDDVEVVWRIDKRHHAGLIVASADSERVQHLLDEYLQRFRHDYFASMPAPDRATS